jgi:hypothetical protein
MNPHIKKAKLIALIVFSVASLTMIGYHFLYGLPASSCEKNGGWWSMEKRACYTPIYLPALTGRKAGEPRQIYWPSTADPTRTAPKPKSLEAQTQSPEAQSKSSASASSVTKAP